MTFEEDPRAIEDMRGKLNALVARLRRS